MSGKILIVGDIHLGKGTSLGKTKVGEIYNSRHKDQINLLYWILQEVRLKFIEVVIITGDVFEDAKPDYPLLQVLLQFLQELSALGVETHIILGNHDLRRIGQIYYSILEILDSINLPCVYVHKQISHVNYFDLDFIFIPFIDRRSLECETQAQAIQYLENKISEHLSTLSHDTTKIVVGHLTLEGALYVGDEIDDLTNEIFCPLDMFDDFDYVWMGHIHKPQVLKKKPYLAHVGSLDLSNFEEQNQTKILIMINPDSEFFFEHVPVPARPLRSFVYEVPEPTQDQTDLEIINRYSTDKILESLQADIINKDIHHAIVRLEIKLPPICPPLLRQEIEDFIFSNGAHYISSFTESRKTIVVKHDKSVLDSSIEPKKAITKWAQEKLPEDKQSPYINYMHQKIDKIISRK